jgi:transposase
MDTPTFSLFVGIDWAEKKHDFCAISPDGRPVGHGTIPHTAAGFASLAAKLLQWSRNDPAGVAVATETPRGPVVDACLHYGFAVFALNPKQLDRFRDRFSPSGSKNDQLDARVLADSLRTDTHLFRAVQPDDERTLRLRGLTVISEDLRHQERRLANRLRDLLVHTRPALLELSPAADDPFLWELLDRAKTPEQAARMHAKTVQSVLKNHRIRRLTASQVIDALRAPRLIIAKGAIAAAEQHIRYLIPQLQLIREQIATCEHQIADVMEEIASDPTTPPDPGPDQLSSPPTASDQPPDAPDEPTRLHSDAAIIRSCVGVGPATTAALFAEAPRAIHERNLTVLRTLCGVAPVTQQSGKSRTVKMRYACSHRLRQAVHLWALAAIRIDPVSRQHYDRLKAKGHNHNRAVRGVIDRLLDVLVAMLKTHSLYDPSRRSTHAPQTT